MAENTLTHQVNVVLKKLTEDIKSNKLELPSPPDLLIKIRTVANDQNATTEDIADIIKLDFNISGRLIKVANCALFGKRIQVSSVKAAISRLGLARVQSLIIGLTIAQNLLQFRTKGLEDFSKQIWKQGNMVSAIAHVLAKHKTRLDPEQAFLAGMVHNIGALPLMLKLNTIAELHDNPAVMRMVADAVIPKLYPTAGKLIMEQWNFPADIVQVATSHQQLHRHSTGEIDLSDLILIAYQLSLRPLSDTEENGLAELITSDAFIKFWPDLGSVISDMNDFDYEINQMHRDISE